MKFRYSVKELENMSNKKLLQCLIDERKSDLNPYSPLRKRLNKLQNEEKLNYNDVYEE